MISIVIPAWNRQTFLPECIRSIQAQTYKDWELIIIDDGSTDESWRLYDYYQKEDKRIKVIFTSHGGIAKARNMGIKSSKGEYIAVFDSDDVMMPDRLKENLKALKKYDFCSSWYWISDVRLNSQVSQLIAQPNPVTYEDVKANRAWPHFMLTAKRKCFIENPYREEFSANDDSGLVWDWFRAGYTNTIIQKPLGVQRGHSNNTSKTKLKKLAEVQAILDKEYAEYENKNNR